LESKNKLNDEEKRKGVLAHRKGKTENAAWTAKLAREKKRDFTRENKAQKEGMGGIKKCFHKKVTGRMDITCLGRRGRPPPNKSRLPNYSQGGRKSEKKAQKKLDRGLGAVAATA